MLRLKRLKMGRLKGHPKPNKRMLRIQRTEKARLILGWHHAARAKHWQRAFSPARGPRLSTSWKRITKSFWQKFNPKRSPHRKDRPTVDGPFWMRN